MQKKVVLDKRWKEIVFSASGFGPNLLMVLMMAYFTDAVMPNGLSADINFWSYGGVTIVFAAVFPILWTIGRFFDGIIDVPLAALTDSIKSTKGKRFLTITISFLPMIVSFILCWIPVFGKNPDIGTAQQVGNSIWIFFWSLIFFASYTLALITFYGSLSEVCIDQTQRSRVASYKSIFDTISYALVYAAIPFVFKLVKIPIWQAAIILSPLMLTILIPVFFKQTVTEEPKIKETKVGIWTSIGITFKSKPFLKWLIVNCVGFFGLQMFLASQNALVSGVMNLGAAWAALLNTCAFAPVPIMLYFFNKVRKKKGVRFSYQTCLLCFAIAIMFFLFGSQYFWGNNLAPKLVFGCVGAVIGSWGIGGFFMLPYLIPTLIASVENEVTHKNHSAMYFAVQALTTSAVGAIASSLIYNYLKTWTQPSPYPGYEWKCGVSLVPMIVFIGCIVAFFLCFLMPKRYTPKVIYNDIIGSITHKINSLKRKKDKEIQILQNKINEINGYNISEEEKKILIENVTTKSNLVTAKIALEISKQEEVLHSYFDEKNPLINEEKDEIYEKSGYLNDIFLFILSAGIYGIVNYIERIKKLNGLQINISKTEKVLIVLSALIPFVSIYTNYLVEKKLINYCKNNAIVIKERNWLVILTSVLLPIFLNLYDILRKDSLFNKILELQGK